MSDFKVNSLFDNNPKILLKSYLLLAVSSLCSLAVTFAASSSNLSFETKLIIFISTVLLYSVFCLVGYFWQKGESDNLLTDNSPYSPINDEIVRKLLALEEANRFFGASLKSNDMFRLVASRVNEIVPFSTLVLFTADAETSKLTAVQAVGENAAKFSGSEISFEKGLAGRVFAGSKAELDENLFYDKRVFGAEKLQNLNAAMAVPLNENGNTYGVLQLYTTDKTHLNQKSLALFETVAARVESLFLSSRAFEENLANALTDALTDLPNERAFFLVLENQIAESQRFREQRPLTVLTIDVKNFDELNQQYGHAAGDRMLCYVADKVKNQLRQMDFLARASGDEFLAVLPTATATITQEIVERINKIFVLNPFEVAPQEKIHLQLNFGAASFGKHGETAEELIKHGYLLKQQSKTAENNNILWFPKEYVN